MTEFTYKAETQAGTGMGGRDFKMRDGFRGRVVRSDGVVVWSGNLWLGPADKRRAQFEANQSVGGFRRYYAAHGRCWYDVRQEEKALKEAGKKARAALRDRIVRAMSAGINARLRGDPLTVCPFPSGSAEAAVFAASYDEAGSLPKEAPIYEDRPAA